MICKENACQHTITYGTQRGKGLQKHSQRVPLQWSSQQVRMLRVPCGMGNEAGGPLGELARQAACGDRIYEA